MSVSPSTAYAPAKTNYDHQCVEYNISSGLMHFALSHCPCIRKNGKELIHPCGRAFFIHPFGILCYHYGAVHLSMCLSRDNHLHVISQNGLQVWIWNLVHVYSFLIGSIECLKWHRSRGIDFQFFQKITQNVLELSIWNLVETLV